MSARLRAVHSAEPSAGAAALKGLRGLVLAAVPELAALIDCARPDEGLVDVASFVGVSKQRPIAGPCRRGEITNARKVARRWKAPAASVRAWLEVKGPRLVGPRNAEGDELEPMRRRLLAGGRR
jgi:hypothetical protein